MDWKVYIIYNQNYSYCGATPDIEKRLRKEFAFQIEVNELDKILTVVEKSIDTNDKNNIELNQLKKIFYL